MGVTNKLTSSPLKLILKFLPLQDSNKLFFIIKWLCPFLFVLPSLQGMASRMNLKQKIGKQNCSCIVILKLQRYNGWGVNLCIWALLNLLHISHKYIQKHPVVSCGQTFLHEKSSGMFARTLKSWWHFLLISTLLLFQVSVNLNVLKNFKNYNKAWVS